MFSQSSIQDIPPTCTSTPSASFSGITCPCSNICPNLHVHSFLPSVSVASVHLFPHSSSLCSLHLVCPSSCLSPIPVSHYSSVCVPHAPGTLKSLLPHRFLTQPGNTQSSSALSLVPLLAPGWGKLSIKNVPQRTMKGTSLKFLQTMLFCSISQLIDKFRQISLWQKRHIL